MSGAVLGIGDTGMNKTEPSWSSQSKSVSFLIMLLIFIGGHLLLKELVPSELIRGLIGRTSLYTL